MESRCWFHRRIADDKDGQLRGGSRVCLGPSPAKKEVVVESTQGGGEEEDEETSGGGGGGGTQGGRRNSVGDVVQDGVALVLLGALGLLAVKCSVEDWCHHVCLGVCGI